MSKKETTSVPHQPNQSIDASYYVRAERRHVSEVLCKKRTFSAAESKEDTNGREIEGKRVPGKVLSDHSVELTMSCIQISYSSPFVSAFCSLSLCDHQRKDLQTGKPETATSAENVHLGASVKLCLPPEQSAAAHCFWNTQ